jgi:hypothetical protein
VRALLRIRGFLMIRIAVGLVALLVGISTASGQEYVWVQNRGLVDIEPLTCTNITRSNFLKRVCYDEQHDYLLVALNEKWLHYCEVDSSIVRAFIAADRAASFYNSNIRSGPFDCRNKRMPKYDD